MQSLYTGKDDKEALERAEANLKIVTANLHAFNPEISWSEIQKLDNCVIGGVKYYYKFLCPYDHIRQGYKADLEVENDEKWINKILDDPCEFA